MTDSISLRQSEILTLMINSLKSRLMQKLKRVNASATFNVNQDEWLANLFVGNLKTKTLNLPMGEAYEFQMVLCACADGRLIMELIFQADFEKEMKAHQLDPKLVKRVGTCSAPTEIFCEDFLNFYLEDLIIKNMETGDVKKQMFGENGHMSWEISGLSWELNITGIATPAPKSIMPPALIPPVSTPATVGLPTTTVPPPPISMGTTTVANVTNQVSYAAPPPTYSGVTALPTGQQTFGRQPPILGLIQQSLQQKAPSVHTVQYLTNSRAFNIPPPSFPVHNPVRGKSPPVPNASTPKKKQNKKKGGRSLKKIIPLPARETSEDETSEDTQGAVVRNHDYETLGEESQSSISEIDQAPLSSTSQEYIPANKVASMVEEAIRQLLSEGVLIRANESNEKTVVQVDLEQAEQIRNLSDASLQEQPVAGGKEKQPGEMENATEKGESNDSVLGPETRSRAKSKPPE